MVITMTPREIMFSLIDKLGLPGYYKHKLIELEYFVVSYEHIEIAADFKTETLYIFYHKDIVFAEDGKDVLFEYAQDCRTGNAILDFDCFDMNDHRISSTVRYDAVTDSSRIFINNIYHYTEWMLLSHTIDVLEQAELIEIFNPIKKMKGQ